MHTPWSSGAELGSPITPPLPYSGLPEVDNWAITSHPREIAASPGSSPRSATTSDDASSKPDYARPDDWIKYRGIITTLWKGEGRTLPEIEQIMERQYGFRATQRMYKTRFQEWGLYKNFTMKRLSSLVEEIEKAEATGSMMADIDLDKINQAIKSAKRNKSADLQKSRLLDQLSKFHKKLSIGVDPGRSYRVNKSSILKRKHGKRQSPRSLPAMPWWSSGIQRVEGVPDETIQALRSAIGAEFNTASYSFSSPFSFASAGVPAPAHPWQPEASDQGPPPGAEAASSIETASKLDEAMLNFAIRLRYAHILLDDGLQELAMHEVNQCFNTLSHYLQPTHDANSKASTVVLIYVMSAALEMAINFNHLSILHMLFQHVNVTCAGKHPSMAELAGQMPQLGRDQQIYLLQLTRQMASQASCGFPGTRTAGFEVYSAVVDISISQLPPEGKLAELCRLSEHASVTQNEFMTMWMVTRLAAAVSDAPLAAQQQGIWDPANEYASVCLSGKHAIQATKILVALSYIAGQVRVYRLAGNRAGVQRLASETAKFVETGWGPEDVLTRKFRDEVDCMLAPMEMVYSVPGVTHYIRTSVDTAGGASAGWVQTPTTTAAAAAATHVPFHDATLPAMWSVDSTGNTMGGGGVDMYGGCF